MTEYNRPQNSPGPADIPQGNSSYDDAFYDARYDNSSYDDAYAFPEETAGDAAYAAETVAAADAFAGADTVAGAPDPVDAAELAGDADLTDPAVVDGDVPEKSGPPLRGLAMILTAVALVLILWGAFSLFGDDDGDDAAAPVATAPAPAPDAAVSPAETAAPEAPATQAPEGTPAAPDAVVVDRAATRVTVLNNSNEPIAESTADRLRGAQWSDTGYGNLEGRIEGISEESRVYYPEGNVQAQAAAEEVARDLGLEAVPGNADYYNQFGAASLREGGRADGVVVVLTAPLA